MKSHFTNRLGLYWPLMRRRTRSYGMPNIVIIETTNHCDRTCQICPHQISDRPRGFIDLKLYRKIIDQIPKAELVFPYYLGESLLHKDIYEMVAYSRSKGHFTSISTGGTLLTEDNSLKIIRSGLNHLQISLHSTNEVGYREIDSKSDFQMLLDQIDRFLGLNQGKVDTYISIINLPSGLGDWRSFSNTWSKKGAKVRFKFFTDWNSGSPTIRKFSSPLQRQKKDVFPCDWLWQQFHILWDGKVVPCCFDYDGSHPLGDVNTSPIQTIWNGPAYVQLRQAHVTNGAAVALCAKCSRRRKPWYEIPFHVFFNASKIYKMRLTFEKKPRKYFG